MSIFSLENIALFTGVFLLSCCSLSVLWICVRNDIYHCLFSQMLRDFRIAARNAGVESEPCIQELDELISVHTRSDDCIPSVPAMIYLMMVAKNKPDREPLVGSEEAIAVRERFEGLTARLFCTCVFYGNITGVMLVAFSKVFHMTAELRRVALDTARNFPRYCNGGLARTC
jgi:hypothetical protein